MIRVGIIGSGNVAQTQHIPAYRAYKQPVEIVAIAGRDEERTRKVADQFQIQDVYNDVPQMFLNHKLDIVSVCSPNNLHYAHVMQSLNANCHVLCEKPPAINYEQAKEMMLKAKEANRILSYNLCYRQLKEVEILKELIENGEFGKVYHIKASFLRRRGIPGWGQFTNKEIQGGGALMDIGIHVLDLALFLLNYSTVKSVLGNTYDHIGKIGGFGLMGEWNPETFSVEDSCFAQISFKDNCSVSLETSFALNMEPTKIFNLEIYGSKMGAQLQPLKLFTANDKELIDIDHSVHEQLNYQEKNIHCFLDGCFGEKNTVCTSEEGVKLQALIESIYKSAHTKTVINFDRFF